jgi:3-phytase
VVILAASCSQNPNSAESEAPEALKPLYVTDTVNWDSDDPAIWIHPDDPSKSLILGTDKKEGNQGGLFVFDLKGKIDTSLVGFDRPNNVDVTYGITNGSDTFDIAVLSERKRAMLRVVRLPDMKIIDNGGIPVFEDDAYNEVMGVALYKRPDDGAIFAMASRKENPDNDNDYLYQYRLTADSTGMVSGTLVRKFGNFSGVSEIEAIAVDNELGYVYYSDEGHAVRKYYADPNKGNEELSSFGLDGFTDDREGISIYKTGDKTGYILVSDQEAHQFHIFPREGTANNPHEHPLLHVAKVQAMFSDGSEVTNRALNKDFPKGLFVAMSDNKTFEIYRWETIENDMNAGSERAAQ